MLGLKLTQLVTLAERSPLKEGTLDLEEFWLAEVGVAFSHSMACWDTIFPSWKRQYVITTKSHDSSMHGRERGWENKGVGEGEGVGK